jgi:hypothetical protein
MEAGLESGSEVAVAIADGVVLDSAEPAAVNRAVSLAETRANLICCAQIVV